MAPRWWQTMLLLSLVLEVPGCCGLADKTADFYRAHRATRRHRRFRNETGTARRDMIRVKRGKLKIPLHRLKELQDMDFGELLSSLRGASNPAFASFIADTNTTGRPIGVGTGLLGAARPSLLGSSSSPLAMDLQEVASERRNVIKDAGCRPRKVPVHVPPPTDPLVVYTPSCVLLPRCSGCCGHELLECVPSKVKRVRKKVLALRFADDESISPDGQESSVKRIEMEKHVECECTCRVKASNCSVRQVYDAGNCRCFCSNEHEAASCPGTKIWSETDCACKCAKVDECSTGLEFDPVQCRCLPSPSRLPLRSSAVQSSGGGAAAATPTVPDRRGTQGVISSGASSSGGWGTAVSSGVIEDRPPPPRSRPAQPSNTYTPYQPSYPDRQYDQERTSSQSAARRYDQSGAESRYSERRPGGAGGAGQYRSRYESTAADPRRTDSQYQGAYSSRYHGRWYG